MHFSPFNVRLWLLRTCLPVNHDGVKVHNHTRDGCNDGGHDFLEAARGGAQAEGHAGMLKDPHVSQKSSEDVKGPVGSLGRGRAQRRL